MPSTSLMDVDPSLDVKEPPSPHIKPSTPAQDIDPMLDTAMIDCTLETSEDLSQLHGCFTARSMSSDDCHAIDTAMPVADSQTASELDNRMAELEQAVMTGSVAEVIWDYDTAFMEEINERFKRLSLLENGPHARQHRRPGPHSQKPQREHQTDDSTSTRRRAYSDPILLGSTTEPASKKVAFDELAERWEPWKYEILGKAMNRYPVIEVLTESPRLQVTKMTRLRRLRRRLSNS